VRRGAGGAAAAAARTEELSGEPHTRRRHGGGAAQHTHAETGAANKKTHLGHGHFIVENGVHNLAKHRSRRALFDARQAQAERAVQPFEHGAARDEKGGIHHAYF
jgi:hypothetical protein